MCLSSAEESKQRKIAEQNDWWKDAAKWKDGGTVHSQTEQEAIALVRSGCANAEPTPAISTREALAQLHRTYKVDELLIEEDRIKEAARLERRRIWWMKKQMRQAEERDQLPPVREKLPVIAVGESFEVDIIPALNEGIRVIRAWQQIIDKRNMQRDSARMRLSS